MLVLLMTKRVRMMVMMKMMVEGMGLQLREYLLPCLVFFFVPLSFSFYFSGPENSEEMASWNLWRIRLMDSVT